MSFSKIMSDDWNGYNKTVDSFFWFSQPFLLSIISFILIARHLHAYFFHLETIRDAYFCTQLLVLSFMLLNQWIENVICEIISTVDAHCSLLQESTSFNIFQLALLMILYGCCLNMHFFTLEKSTITSKRIMICLEQTYKVKITVST